ITTVSLSALVFSFINVLLNLYLLFMVFCKSKFSKNSSGLFLIYFRFAVDMLYSFASKNTCFLTLNFDLKPFSATIHFTYNILRMLSPDLVVKNLSFFIAWPNLIFGSIRSWTVLFITIDRVLATCIPIIYHLHRSKFPLLAVSIYIFAYVLFEQYILFGICAFIIDVPLSCANFGCTTNPCYHDYWEYYEQIMHFCVGTLSVLLCFRLFVWNNCSHSTNNQTISRATRISLLDSFIIFVFDLLPIFLMSNFPEVNFRSVGPLSALCKNFGFVIESIITCGVLIGKNQQVQPGSVTRISRSVIVHCFNLTYFLIRVVSPDTVVKNLSFYIAWPTYNLGSIRVFLVFFIIIDRLCASYFPIFYHKNRSKLPNLSIFLSLFVYAIFEQIILFKFCQFEIDIPTSCLHLGCSVNKCYHDYWLWFEQTTRISLLDTVIIFAFDILPSFLFTHFPAVNFETVGPLSALCKNFGFVIEAIIICKVLIGK
ncbi:LOW QUALITY PROTEIN: Protein CBR-SRBC-59, partial [Caenorhabditis briggsae]